MAKTWSKHDYVIQRLPGWRFCARLGPVLMRHGTNESGLGPERVSLEPTHFFIQWASPPSCSAGVGFGLGTEPGAGHTQIRQYSGERASHLIIRFSRTQLGLSQFRQARGEQTSREVRRLSAFPPCFLCLPPAGEFVNSFSSCLGTISNTTTRLPRFDALIGEEKNEEKDTPSPGRATVLHTHTRDITRRPRHRCTIALHILCLKHRAAQFGAQ